MYYLLPDGEQFIIVYDSNELPEEDTSSYIELEHLPEGDGILRRDYNGKFYYDPIHEEVVKPEMTDEEMRFTTLLNTEYLVIMSEMNNIF